MELKMDTKNLDVAKIMAAIAEEAQKRYGQFQEEKEVAAEYPALEPLRGDLCQGIKQRNHIIHISLPNARACDGLHVRIPEYADRGAVKGRLYRFISRVVSKLSRFIVYQQNIVNNTLCNTTELLQTSVLTVADWSAEVERRINELNASVERLQKENRQLRQSEEKPKSENKVVDKFYLDFEKQHRGSKEEIKNRLRYYLDNYVFPRVSQEECGMILDIGCGRGEWLELLEENGYNGIGIDTNRESLGECECETAKLYCVDAISFLKTLPAESVKLLTSFQVVEHLTIDELLELFREIGRVLMKDGLIVMETPNPENVNVGANTFYMDPTHNRPVPAAFLKFVAEECGLKKVEFAYWQQKSMEEWWEHLWKDDDTEIEKSPKYRAIEEELRKHLWCSADYALIAGK